MTLEQKIKEIEELAKISELYGCKFELALELIRELQKENTELKARLQPTPEAPEIDKITCLEADVSLRDDRIEELEKQLDAFKVCIPKKHPSQEICANTIKGRFAMLELELQEATKQLDRVRDTWELYNILVGSEIDWKKANSNENLFKYKTRAIQNYILGGEGGK